MTPDPHSAGPGRGAARHRRNPREEYQAVADAMSDALAVGDIDRYASHFALPLVTSNLDGAETVRSQDTLRELAEGFANSLSDHGITRVNRVCEAARIDPSGCLDGYHLTSFTGPEDDGPEPVRTRFVMTAKPAGWQIRRVETGLNRTMWPVRRGTFKPAPGQPLSDEAFTAHTVFQTMLNVATLHVLNGDAEGFASLALLPIFIQSRQGRYVIQDLDALKKDVALYRSEFDIHGVDDIYRPMKSAEFVGAEKITGTYRTYILSNGRLVVEPYESSMTLQKCPDRRWRITSIMHGLGHLNWKYPGGGD